MMNSDLDFWAKMDNFTLSLGNLSNIATYCYSSYDGSYDGMIWYIGQFSDLNAYILSFLANLGAKVFSITTVSKTITEAQKICDYGTIYNKMGTIIRLILDVTPAETASYTPPPPVKKRKNLKTNSEIASILKLKALMAPRLETTEELYRKYYVPSHKKNPLHDLSWFGKVFGWNKEGPKKLGQEITSYDYFLLVKGIFNGTRITSTPSASYCEVIINNQYTSY